MLTFALPTGRTLSDCIDILAGAGMPAEKLKNPGRSLVIEEGQIRYLLSKPADVPMMVHYGAADMGLAGSDVICESGIQISELLDTGRGRCTMAVAGPAETAEKFKGHVSGLMGLKVATKYPNIAEQTFAAWGVHIKLMKLNGSVELAPALGLSDCIFDIVQTGSTLRANGLEPREFIADISSRLIVNKASMKMKHVQIQSIIDCVAGAIDSAR